MKSQKIKLNSVLVGVRDIIKSVKFYESVFGVTFSEIRPPFSCFTFDGIEFNIEEISPERSVGWEEKYIGTAKCIAFEVENMETFLNDVQQAGGKIIVPPRNRPWGWQDAEFSDIDGNIFIVEKKL